MAIPLPPPPTTSAPRAPAPRWVAAALAGAVVGALLLVAVSVPAAGPVSIVPGGDGAPARVRSTAAAGPWRPVRLPLRADAVLSRYPILLQDDTSGAYFEPAPSLP